MKSDFQKAYFQFIIFRLKEDKNYDGRIKSMTPSEVNDNLEELGWRRESFDTNGWQQDTWMTYYHMNYPFGIVVAYSGYYGDMHIYREEVE